MKKAKQYIFLFALVAASIFSVKLVKHYLGTTQKGLAERLQTLALIKQGDQRVMAYFADKYDALKVNNSVQAYYIDYTYTVNGQQYKQQQQFEKPPTVTKQEVYYLPADPSFSSFNPQQDYDKCKTELDFESGGQAGAWFIAIAGWATATLLFLSFRKDRQKQKEYAE